MTVSFMAAVGSTYIAPSANTWVTGNYLAAPSQINAAAIASSTMFFTGVLVLPGIYAPTAAQSPLIMRPFDQELRTCQRYYAKTYPYDVLSASVRGTGGGLIYLGGGAGGSFLSGYWSFPVEMRTGPTMQIYNNAGGASNASYYSSSGWADGAAVAVLNANSNGVGLYAVTGGVIHLINFDLIATARL
jgi:hypothetical protein